MSVEMMEKLKALQSSLFTTLTSGRVFWFGSPVCTDKLSKEYVRDRELGALGGSRGRKGAADFFLDIRHPPNEMARNSSKTTCFSLRRDFQSLGEPRIEHGLPRWRKQRAESGAAEVPGN